MISQSLESDDTSLLMFLGITYYFLANFGRGHPVVFEAQILNKIIYLLSLTQQYIYYINP